MSRAVRSAAEYGKPHGGGLVICSSTTPGLGCEVDVVDLDGWERHHRMQHAILKFQWVCSDEIQYNFIHKQAEAPFLPFYQRMFFDAFILFCLLV